MIKMKNEEQQQSKGQIMVGVTAIIKGSGL